MADGPPEYQLRETLGQGPTPSVRALPIPDKPIAPDLTAGSKALSALGEQVSSFAEKLSSARDQAEATTASSDFTKQLEQLQDQYSKDPEYKTALERFQKDRTSLQMDLAQNISNDTLRQKTQLEWERSGVVAANRVSMAALRTQKGAVDDAVSTVADNSLKNYSEAQSPGERVAALELFHGTVKGAVDSGWVDAAIGEKLVSDFGVKAGVLDATNLIKADPVFAQHALLEKSEFPTLDAPLRAGLIRTAQDTLTQQEETAAAAPVAQAFAMFAQGKLTPDALGSQAAALPLPTLGTLARAIEATPPAQSDPNAIWQLLDQGNRSSDAALAAGAEARAAGGITDPMLQTVLGVAVAVEKASPQIPWLQSVRGDLIASLKPTDTQHPDSAIQQFGAVNEFDKYAAQNPQVSEFDARAEASKLARDARSAAAFNERFVTPLPQFSTAGPAGLTREKLVEAAARTMEAGDNRWLSDDELVEQVDLMRGWQDILARETDRGGK